MQVRAFSCTTFSGTSFQQQSEKRRRQYGLCLPRPVAFRVGLAAASEVPKVWLELQVFPRLGWLDKLRMTISKRGPLPMLGYRCR